MKYITSSGLEVRLYPNVVEFWRNGVWEFAMTPQEYGETMRWMEDSLREKAQWPFSTLS